MVSAVGAYDTTLILENKDAGWNEIKGDGIRGVLWFNSSGYEFEYRFKAKGLTADTDYSLIYYADPWPGDNPGAVIAEFTSNDKGRIKWTSGSVELGMGLPCVPDANYPGGAKIWLVPTADLTGGQLPMSAWHPTKILFECKLITFSDKGVAPQEKTGLTVLMPFGRTSTSYIGDSNVLRGNAEVTGVYDGTGYKLVIPEGCVIERPSGKRLYTLYLKDIGGDTLTFTTGKGSVSFSEPCILYTTKGELTLNMWGKLVSDGEWVEAGSFTSIIGGEAVLE